MVYCYAKIKNEIQNVLFKSWWCADKLELVAVVRAKTHLIVIDATGIKDATVFYSFYIIAWHMSCKTKPVTLYLYHSTCIYTRTNIRTYFKCGRNNNVQTIIIISHRAHIVSIACTHLSQPGDGHNTQTNKQCLIASHLHLSTATAAADGRQLWRQHLR